DKYINEEKPWELAKKDSDRLKSVLAHCIDRIQEISILLQPFMPETSEKILKQFSEAKIVSQKPLFPRL
ncbi:MAG TPA: methionine--tRNA ligase, partial [Patescibacteria group bacterium]|nr:methionine--tRNA ligase [Patescibacteria group bacterium]